MLFRQLLLSVYVCAAWTTAAASAPFTVGLTPTSSGIALLPGLQGIGDSLTVRPYQTLTIEDESKQITISKPDAQARFSDSNGDTYHIVTTSRSETARNVIDSAFEKILATQMGQQLCRFVLYDSQLSRHVYNLKKHLGISSLAARRQVDKCRHINSAQRHSFFYPSTAANIAKHSPFYPDKIAQGLGEKNYTFLLTRKTQWDFDSWTDSSNQTFIVLEDPDTDQAHKGVSSQNTELHILRVLAHEIAVYFDIKQNAGTADWEGIIRNQNPTILDLGHYDEFKVALNNPLVQQVLTTWRAVIFEDTVLRQITQLYPKYKSSYRQQPIDKEYAFLFDTSCKEDCLHNRLIEETHRLTPKSLFYSALRPTYRYEKWAQYRAENPHLNHRGTTVQQALIEFPGNLLESYLPSVKFAQLTSTATNSGYVTSNEPLFSYSDFFYLLVDPAVYHKNIYAAYICEGQYRREFLPSDLKAIWSAVDARFESHNPILTYLKTPFLGSININYTYGPRPRIRTGGQGVQ